MVCITGNCSNKGDDDGADGYMEFKGEEGGVDEYKYEDLVSDILLNLYNWCQKLLFKQPNYDSRQKIMNLL